MLAILLPTLLLQFNLLHSVPSGKPLTSELPTRYVPAIMSHDAAFPGGMDKRQQITYEEEKIVTGYTLSEDETDAEPCISASGKNLCVQRRDAVCAADYPFGTRLYIPDFGYCVVEDRMAKRFREQRVDVLFGSKQEAKKWGKRKLDIFVYN